MILTGTHLRILSQEAPRTTPRLAEAAGPRLRRASQRSPNELGLSRAAGHSPLRTMALRIGGGRLVRVRLRRSHTPVGDGLSSTVESSPCLRTYLTNEIQAPISFAGARGAPVEKLPICRSQMHPPVRAWVEVSGGRLTRRGLGDRDGRARRAGLRGYIARLRRASMSVTTICLRWVVSQPSSRIAWRAWATPARDAPVHCASSSWEIGISISVPSSVGVP